MIAVANDTSGTAYRQSQLGLGDIRMAGKTGTAQVRVFREGESRKSAGFRWGLRDHNWYIAFAPIEAPRYAISVLIEHGGLGGGTAAAPRAREVMRMALLKDPEIRARVEQPLPLPELDPAAPIEGAAPEPAIEGVSPPPAPAPKAAQ
jgi:penicillin-binding protein 2